MRALVQRVSCATVRVQGEVVAAIGPGLLVLLALVSIGYVGLLRARRAGAAMQAA